MLRMRVFEENIISALAIVVSIGGYGSRDVMARDGVLIESRRDN